MGKPVKAYRTRALGVDCVVFAKSRGAARYATFRAANDAGYDIGFGDVEFCRRDELLDSQRGASHHVGTCYKPEEFAVRSSDQ